jgi:hypothetical protein
VAEWRDLIVACRKTPCFCEERGDPSASLRSARDDVLIESRLDCFAGSHGVLGGRDKFDLRSV